MPKAYFIGLKGVGMTSLALAMQDAGWEVSGCDTEESFITDEILAKRRIPVNPSLENPPPADADEIIYSGAYSFAGKAKPLAEALAAFVRARKVIAIAGVGGKTTTAAMLAALMRAAGREVGYYVGTGSIVGLEAPGASGGDPWYVVESDEYAISKADSRPKFAILEPEIVITTNIVFDHPDIYRDENATFAAFSSLIDRLPSHGAWIYNADDRLTQKILAALKPQCRLLPYTREDLPLELSVFGAQNQLDAHAAVLAATAVGISREQAEQAIKAYRGAGRRQEYHGNIAGRELYDDYGHHPHEIKATVASFHERFPGQRLLLVFESHTYSRTETLLPDFSQAIATADVPFIMPIFESAREKGKPHRITPASFAAEVAKYNSLASSLTWENAAEKVWEISRPGDIILTMGAGFVYKLHEQFRNKQDGS